MANRDSQSLVVSLLPPPVTQGRKCRRIGSAKESCCSNHTLQSKHRIPFQHAHHIRNGRNLDVIHHQPSARKDMRVKVEILQFWKRISMRSIQQNQIELAIEGEGGDRLLGGPKDEFARFLPQQRTALDLAEGMPLRVFPGEQAECERHMPLGSVRQRQGAFPAACLSGVLRSLRATEEIVHDGNIEGAALMPACRKSTNRFNDGRLGQTTSPASPWFGENPSRVPDVGFELHPRCIG
jgi:hypothetical protein